MGAFVRVDARECDLLAAEDFQPRRLAETRGDDKGKSRAVGKIFSRHS